MDKEKMTGIDLFFYYLFVIISLGGAYLYKTIIKKALSEMIK